MVSTSYKISCPLARISSFSEICFPPNSNNGFHQQEKSSVQKTLFPLDRKSFFNTRMKKLLKNAFPLYGKVVCTLKNFKISENIEKKKWCLLAEIYLTPSSNNSSHQQKKHRTKDWLKNMFQLKKNLLPLAAVDCCQKK